MRLKNVKQLCMGGELYPNKECDSDFVIGDVVINPENEVGVIIQIHEENEFRTDMFGNCCSSEIRLATDSEIKEFRPNIKECSVEDFWLDLTLREIIVEYKEGSENEPLDGDAVDRVCEIIKAKINLHEGNITPKEYTEILDGTADSKAERIDYIKGVIRQYGEFDMSDVQSEVCPVFSKPNKINETLVKRFGLSEVTCIEYEHGLEVNQIEVSYEDLNDELLRDIEYITEIYEADMGKTYKRCED